MPIMMMKKKSEWSMKLTIEWSRHEWSREIMMGGKKHFYLIDFLK